MSLVNGPGVQDSNGTSGTSAERVLQGLISPGSLILLYAVIAVLLIPVFPHFVSPNEFSRWATTISLVERGDGSIDWSIPVIGRTEDTAEVDGSFYSNKPPGTSIAGTPGYVATKMLGADASSIRLSMTMMRLAAATLPVVLIGLLLVWCGKRLRLPPDRVTLAIAALLFGTPLFTYGLLYFSHALTAFGLFLAVSVGFIAPTPSARLNGLAIGIGLGIAGWSEYTAALPVILIMGVLILQRRGQEFFHAVIGGTPFLAGLLLYQWAAFGTPFAVANAFESHGEFSVLSETGIFGIGLPSISRMFRLLLDPTNGLFLLSPVLIGSLISVRGMARKLPRSTFWLVVLLPLVSLILFSGYPNWHGGWSVGPRYLVPVLPILALPLLFAEASRWFYALLGWSVAAVVLVTTTFPFVPNGMWLPWGSLGLGLIRNGLVAPNLLHLIAPFLAAAFPWLITSVVLASVPSKGRVPAVAGLIACLLTGGAALQLATPIMTLQRTYIEAVYFEDPEAYEREFGPGFVSPSPLADRAQRERQSPPPSWPFR